MRAKDAWEIRYGIELARGDQRRALNIILFRGVSRLAYEAYRRTFARRNGVDA